MIQIPKNIRRIIESESYVVDNIGMSDSFVYLFPDTFGEGGFENPKELLSWLKENRSQEELVLSHGDFCLPNIFFTESKVSGFIDLGKMCVADRYQDIALCYRSLTNNLDGSYGGKVRKKLDENQFFHKLGIIPDWEKIRYYILLDELF